MIVALLAYLGHLIGTLIAKFGLFIQKRLHLQLESAEKNKDEDKRILDTVAEKKETPVYCRWQWLVGFAFIIVGGLI